MKVQHIQLCAGHNIWWPYMAMLLCLPYLLSLPIKNSLIWESMQRPTIVYICCLLSTWLHQEAILSDWHTLPRYVQIHSVVADGLPLSFFYHRVDLRKYCLHCLLSCELVVQVMSHELFSCQWRYPHLHSIAISQNSSGTWLYNTQCQLSVLATCGHLC